jgi:hypothetical protein
METTAGSVTLDCGAGRHGVGTGAVSMSVVTHGSGSIAQLVEPKGVGHEPRRARIVDFGLLFPRAVRTAKDEIAGAVTAMILNRCRGPRDASDHEVIIGRVRISSGQVHRGPAAALSVLRGRHPVLVVKIRMQNSRLGVKAIGGSASLAARRRPASVFDI